LSSVIGVANASVHSSQVQKYAWNSVKQQEFNKRVLDMVVQDVLPLDAPSGIGLQQLISSIDPKLNIPSRRTIYRLLVEKQERVFLALLYK